MRRGWRGPATLPLELCDCDTGSRKGHGGGRRGQTDGRPEWRIDGDGVEAGGGAEAPSQPRRRERDRGGQANDGEATYVDVEEGRYYMRMERREIGTGEGYLACFLWVEDVRGMANNSKHSTKVGGARIFGSWMCGPRWPNHVTFFRAWRN